MPDGQVLQRSAFQSQMFADQKRENEKSVTDKLGYAF
jgi:hypothetical protein